MWQDAPGEMFGLAAHVMPHVQHGNLPNMQTEGTDSLVNEAKTTGTAVLPAPSSTLKYPSLSLSALCYATPVFCWCCRSPARLFRAFSLAQCRLAVAGQRQIEMRKILCDDVVEILTPTQFSA